MMDIDAAIPRCSHGKILLGCPNDDCPEQQEFLKQHHLTIEAFLEWQKAQARIFVREYLGLPPEVIVPQSLLDVAYEKVDADGTIPTPAEGSGPAK